MANNSNNQKKYASLATLQNFLNNLKNLFATKTDVNAELAKKADSSHTHTIANVTNLQTTLDSKATQTDLNSHANNADVHFTATERTKLSGIAAGAQVNTVTGVKGGSESTYRTGNINITKANIGLGNVDNTADANKSVKHATSADSATSATKATQDGNGKVISSTYETKADSSSKLTEAKTYADNAANAVKNDLLNNAGAAYDTLKELGDLIDDNKDAIDALETVASGKANAVHTHAISDVTGLQSALDGKAANSHGTHVSYSTTAPVMDGTASVGTASTVARSDHKHPTDTSRASKTEFDSHNADTTKHITATERTNWNAAKTHADSAHAPSNAQPNQNAFSNIKVGSTTIVADTTTDTLTLEGTNVTITPDATNDKVTISVADATTSAKGVVQLTDSVTSTSTTTAATPKNVKAAYDLANTAKTNAATAQTRADSAYTLAESKVDSLSDLGVTATAAELNYVNGVTSNVQAQLDGKLSNSMIAYGTCSTAADVADKVVITTNGNFKLVAGAIIHVNFTYANSASFVKLAIDGNDAKSAKRYGSWTLEGGEWKKGQVVKFVYDGASFYMEGGNTTIEAGGTGADNVEDARENLSVYSKEDHEWTLLYDSGAITSSVNAFSGISVAGYSNIAVAVKCVNTSGNSVARAGSIYISTQTGVKYQFPVLTNLFTTSANTSAGMAIFNRVGDYLVCPYATRNINAPNFLKTSLGGTADNLTPVGGGIMRCISPISSVIVSSLDQNSNYYFGAGSQVLVWGWNA
jgi:hypothetical protein